MSEVTALDAALLLLPDGNRWQEAKLQAVLRTATEFLQAGLLVAAICGATEAMAQAGMLDNRPHTSNSLDYLKMAFPNYKGEANFKQEPVVVDKNLITAGNTATADFAYDIIDQLDVFSERTLKAWHLRFQTHDPKHVFELMDSLPKEIGKSMRKVVVTEFRPLDGVMQVQAVWVRSRVVIGIFPV